MCKFGDKNNSKQKKEEIYIAKNKTFKELLFIVILKMEKLFYLKEKNKKS